jgi:hypothetical protein
VTRANEEYEFARKIMKREAKKPNVYTRNRREAMLIRVERDFGKKGLKEFTKEFKRDFRNAGQ